jgi:hypothetical protein
MPPLLLAIERLPDDRARLTVNAKWLAGVFGRVPMPVPTHGNCANALALFLFLAATDQRRASHTNSIATEKLCRRIGIAFRWPAEACEALRNALKAVNNHLAKHCDQQALAKENLPLRFDLLPLADGDRVRFLAHYGTPQGEEEPDIAVSEATDAPEPETAEPASVDVTDQPSDDEALSPAEQRVIELNDREMRQRREWAAFKARLREDQS